MAMMIVGMMPDLSVNTDAPRAALRARAASPITLVRWASDKGRPVRGDFLEAGLWQ